MVLPKMFGYSAGLIAFSIFLNGWQATAVAYLAIYIRTLIPIVELRRCISYIFMIIMFFWSWPLAINFLLTEILRECFIRGVPKGIQLFGEKVPRNNVAETCFKRIVICIREVRLHEPLIIINALFRIHYAYQQQDGSEPFTSDEQARFKKFFEEFDRSYFVFNDRTAAIFFPTFIIYFGSKLVLTNDKSMSINKECREDNCRVCLQTFEKVQIKLNCGHLYCFKCIFKWLEENYNCPLCRSIVA